MRAHGCATFSDIFNFASFWHTPVLEFAFWEALPSVSAMLYGYILYKSKKLKYRIVLLFSRKRGCVVTAFFYLRSMVGIW